MDRTSLGPIMRRTPHSAPEEHARRGVPQEDWMGRRRTGEEKSGRKKSQAFREMTSKKNQEEKTLSHRQFLTTFRLPMTLYKRKDGKSPVARQSG